ncbi:MAG: alanine racemase, partial [Dehalococcoidia bacterium]
MTRPQHAWVEVDLDALEHNISVLKHRAGRAAFAAVVKANGYGLGALAMAESAMAVGAERVCVYNLDEAAFLRAREFKPPILVMGHVPAADAEWALDLDVSLVVTQPDAIAALARAATARRVSLPLHVKVDTGMFRLGAASEAAIALAEAVRAQSSLELEGFCTHFPSADGPDPADTENRFRRFQELAERVGATLRHVAGTATVLRFPQMSLDMVRVGAGLYGIAPGLTGPPEARGLKAVMSWKAFVVQTHDVPAGDAVSYGGTWTAPRDSRVGVVATGYADGFRRSLGNRGFVLVKGARAPVVGA